MNVYDFDGTIYDGDSTVDFWKFCLKRHPSALLALFPTALGGCLYELGLISKTKFKQWFYKFLKFVPNIDDELAVFWERHDGKIKPWYLSQKRDGDLIISASPEFLLTPICEKLCVGLIASQVDKNTGRYTGVNCDGEEKVRRFRLQHHDETVNLFYSDSNDDTPLARIAKEAFWVKGNNITPWEFNKR